MSNRSWLRPSGLVLTGLGALFLAISSFVIVRELRGPAEVSADPPGSRWADRPDGWRELLLDAEDEAPRFDGTLNGIRIAPTLPRGGASCGPGDRAGYVDRDAVRGEAVEIAPSYLPAGTVAGAETVLACPNGTVLEHVIEYEVPTDYTLERFGGGMAIVRGVTGEPRFALDASAERARTAEIAGRPAVVFRPLSEDGFGPSAVIVAEPWGVTAVQAYGLTEDEVVRIAEGLYGSGVAR